jgi:hypothetical protein
MSNLVWEWPIALWLGVPVVLAALTHRARTQWRQGLDVPRVAASAALRGLPLLALVVLAARPIWEETREPEGRRTAVVLLVDRSASMSLEDDGAPRSARALAFARERLLPAIRQSGLRAEALLFAEDAEPADGPALAAAVPDGRRTNLSGAIARAVGGSPKPPLAVIALTDGVATENADNARAISALVEARVPLVGIGFGSEDGARTIAIGHAEAPPAAPRNQGFRVSAQLETTGDGEVPAFDLLLLRDGQFRQQKTVSGGRGSRTWLEGFDVSEPGEGTYAYTIRMMPPVVPGLRCVNDAVTAAVRISEEKELRVLFAQGALAWDYKFINLALQGDPTLKLTGLSRTSSRSYFYQNVEAAGELSNGFPAALEGIAPFRVVVLSNLRPDDLSGEQQDLLAKFCGEYGGGLLLIGGPETFGASWQGSRLERLLPVRFSAASFAPGGERPFHLRLTDEALRHPAFQVADAGTNRAVWDKLPAFTRFGRIDSAKPGAQVWAINADESGPGGSRILMAAQRYGAGTSAIIALQNLWRWRLDKDSDPVHFDRFWRQLFRFLSEGNREEIAIRFPDQDLRPYSEVHASLEKRPDPERPDEPGRKYHVVIEDGEKAPILDRSIELAPSRPLDVSFRSGTPGVYTLTVQDAVHAPIVTRMLEIREVNVEFQRAARDMGNLHQWAGLSDGVAVKAEDCNDTAGLIANLRARFEIPPRRDPLRKPAGVNGWVMTAILTSLGAEWWLRKRWGLI